MNGLVKLFLIKGQDEKLCRVSVRNILTIFINTQLIWDNISHEFLFAVT